MHLLDWCDFLLQRITIFVNLKWNVDDDHNDDDDDDDDDNNNNNNNNNGYDMCTRQYSHSKPKKQKERLHYL